MPYGLPTPSSEQVQSPALSPAPEVLPFIRAGSLLPLHKGIGNFVFNLDACQERAHQIRNATLKHRPVQPLKSRIYFLHNKWLPQTILVVHSSLPMSTQSCLLTAAFTSPWSKGFFSHKLHFLIPQHNLSLQQMCRNHKIWIRRKLGEWHPLSLA